MITAPLGLLGFEADTFQTDQAYEYIKYLHLGTNMYEDENGKNQETEVIDEKQFTVTTLL